MRASEKITRVAALCSSCSGTGLYCGFAEGKNAAVVCGICQGTGKMVLSYVPFTKRRRRKLANGGPLLKVFVRGPVWFTETKERKSISPSEFYKSEQYKAKE